jgi:hypothetical protein
MNQLYLSPAFRKRTDEENEFLFSIDGTTGFALFWIDVVRPLLHEIKARYLLQIGAYKGEHTQHLLKYCQQVDGMLTIIEPVITPELEAILAGASHYKLIADKSLVAIPQIDSPVDVVLLNGDLNYYTAHGDLSAIEELANRMAISFPTVIHKSTYWPYARRDMYYDPDGIPVSARHPAEQMGMTPWSLELKTGMINAPFYNARIEGGSKNGVLTAVEDFIQVSREPLRLFTLLINNGLGIINKDGSKVEAFIKARLMPPPALGLLLETCEIARLNDIIRRLPPTAPGSRVSRLVWWLLAKIKKSWR